MTKLPEEVTEWLGDLRAALDGLPETEREEVMAEAQAHIRDRLDLGVTAERSLDGFGSATAYAGDFLDTYRVERALERRHYGQMVTTLWGLWQRRLNALFGLGGAILFSLLTLASLAFGLANLMLPGQIQVWASDTNLTVWTNAAVHAPMAADMVRLDITAILAGVAVFAAGCAYMVRFSLVAALTALKSQIRRDIAQNFAGFEHSDAHGQPVAVRSIEQRLQAGLGRLNRLIIAVVGFAFAIKFGDVVLNNLDTVRRLVLHPHSHAFWLGPHFSYFGMPSPEPPQPGMHGLPYLLEYGRLLGMALICFYLARFSLTAALKASRPKI